MTNIASHCKLSDKIFVLDTAVPRILFSMLFSKKRIFFCRKMAAYYAVKSSNDRRAKKEAFDKIFARFDHNHNGGVSGSLVVTVLTFNISGKVFVKDFFEELRQGSIEVGDEEVEKLQSFADEDGQVTKDDFKHYCKHSELFQSLDKYTIKVGPITFSEPGTMTELFLILS